MSWLLRDLLSAPFRLGSLHEAISSMTSLIKNAVLRWWTTIMYRTRQRRRQRRKRRQVGGRIHRGWNPINAPAKATAGLFKALTMTPHPR